MMSQVPSDTSMHYAWTAWASLSALEIRACPWEALMLMAP